MGVHRRLATHITIKMWWSFTVSRRLSGLLVLFLPSAIGLCRNAAAGIALPDENNDSESAVRSYLVDINCGNFASAADRYWELAGSHGGDLISRPDGSFVGVRDAIDAVTQGEMAALVTQLRSRHSTDAATIVAAATMDPRYHPHELYTAAMRCRHTAESDAAFTTAATRAIAQGDTTTASLLSNHPAPDSAASVVPFGSTWFGNITGYPAEKVIPVLSGRNDFHCQ